MEGLNGVLFHGLLKSTALVVPNGAPVAVRVAARLASVVFGNRIQICNGVNDHLEIQAALDALPAAGGEVYLLDGTYNCQVTVNLDSNQTLRGCGTNTILATATANLIFLSAVGGAGTELTGITVEDIQIDGGAGSISDCGIYFEFVDYSFIEHVYSRRHNPAPGTGIYYSGIYLLNSDFNNVTANICQGNGFNIQLDTSNNTTVTGNNSLDNIMEGILLWYADGNTISDNVCEGGAETAIAVHHSYQNAVSGNSCQNNTHSITVTGGSSYNTIDGNVCGTCQQYSLYISGSSHNNIVGNYITEASQVANNLNSDIYLVGNSSYNNIEGNVCRAGTLANKPKYGIDVSAATCVGNIISGNDLYDDGFGTASFNDAGALTHVEDNNRGIRLDQIRHFRTVKNTSGAQRVAGDVVSLKAVANGYEVTAPAAVGERQVFGMVAETIDDNAFGLVQTKGKTTVLKSTNAGGGNIVIGDNLITENGVRARKAAAATDPIFARALEACAAANCTIDAYIKSPWD